MSKATIIKKAMKTSGFREADVKVSVNATLEAIAETLKEDGRLVLPGFGTFSTITRKARTGRNPATGEPVQIPEKSVIKFKATF